MSCLFRFRKASRIAGQRAAGVTLAAIATRRLNEAHGRIGSWPERLSLSISGLLLSRELTRERKSRLASSNIKRCGKHAHSRTLESDGGNRAVCGRVPQRRRLQTQREQSEMDGAPTTDQFLPAGATSVISRAPRWKVT